MDMNLLFILLLSMPQVRAQALVTAAKSAAAAKPEIKIISVKGTVVDTSSATQTLPWTLKSRVADRLALSVKAGAQTKIKLNPKLELTLYENSDFEIPVINWETRHFKEMFLTKGTMRLVVEAVPFEFDLVTPFYQVKPPVGIWVFNIDTQQALADVVAFDGKIDITSLNSEDKISLTSGQKGTFKGLLEEGEIAYDLLLQGRKIPKGKWLEASSLSADDSRKFSLEAERKRQEQDKKNKVLAAQRLARLQGAKICKNPFGDLGECYWKKEKNTCVRTRCTADGIWKDSQLVAPAFCEKSGGWTPQPKKCDY